MWFPEAREPLSAVEAVRQISSLLNRAPISPNAFSNPDWVLNTIGDLLVLHFDMQTTPTRFQLPYLLRIALNDLECHHVNFNLSDMGSEFREGKWLQFLACLLPHLHWKTRNTLSKKVYDDAVVQKRNYEKLVEQVHEKELQLANTKTDYQGFNRIKLSHQQQRTEMQKLRADQEKLKLTADELMAKRADLSHKLDELNCDVDSLTKEHQQVCSDLQRDFSSIPVEIARSKARCESIQAEMGQLYDTTRQLNIRNSALQRSHALICNQVPPLLDSARQLSDTYPRLDELVKTRTSQAEALIEQESALTKQIDILQEKTANRKNEVIRERLVLHKKKKAFEAEQQVRDKEMASVKLEIGQVQQRLTACHKDLTSLSESKQVESEAIQMISRTIDGYKEVRLLMKKFFNSKALLH